MNEDSMVREPAQIGRFVRRPSAQQGYLFERVARRCCDDRQGQFHNSSHTAGTPVVVNHHEVIKQKGWHAH